MNARFNRLVQSLEPKLRALLALEPSIVKCLPKQMPERGVYLFSDGATHLYVGRSNSLKRRLRTHCRQSSKENGAALAFLMARRECGVARGADPRKRSRKALAALPKVRRSFGEAKRRIREELQVRWIRVNSPRQQAVLEIYVHIALGTRFNDFDNH